MAWWNPWKRKEATTSSTLDDALTAAAVAVKASRDSTVSPSNDSWQEEAWGYYDQLGEFRYAVNWKAEMISRVRLRAGQVVAGQDEPKLLDEGPAAEIVSELGAGLGGQPAMLESFATQLNVPGEGYLVGETINDVDTWCVRSNDEIRLRNGKYEVMAGESIMNGAPQWRALGNESLVVRVWRPHKRYHHLADSPARSMRPTMRELELVNRKIQAQYLSRLATAGVFMMPDEVTFPVREEFQDAEDPFVREWIETAREAIQNPGTASAVIPIPMRVPAEYTDKFEFIDFSTAEDGNIIEKRESAIRRLATQVDVPAEILLGMGDVNHWSAWQLEESAIKTHISPDVELICNALTIGYLRPRLKAMGLDADDIVVWYDTSELSVKPDKSSNAQAMYDRLELSGKAMRREAGFDEDDAPTQQELRGMILRNLSQNPQIGWAALSELISDPELARRAVPDEGDESAPADEPEGNDDAPADERRGPPDTQDEPPPTPGADMVIQATSMHRLVFDLERWQLYHPQCCDGATINCPVAQASRYLVTYPGTSGSYECWLSPDGNLVLGKRTYERMNDMIPGHSRSIKRKALTNGSG